ncbi:hypothetical protein KCP70_09910 [Salmonella enterica subsp. enterica]|nr:hypothetical protein KCP70_09910 [Salmonella enterica subsp. enterica]
MVPDRAAITSPVGGYVATFLPYRKTSPIRCRLAAHFIPASLAKLVCGETLAVTVVMAIMVPMVKPND